MLNLYKGKVQAGESQQKEDPHHSWDRFVKGIPVPPPHTPIRSRKSQKRHQWPTPGKGPGLTSLRPKFLKTLKKANVNQRQVLHSVRHDTPLNVRTWCPHFNPDSHLTRRWDLMRWRLCWSESSATYSCSQTPYSSGPQASCAKNCHLHGQIAGWTAEKPCG